MVDEKSVPVPSYLNVYYWWAYVHPRAVRFFERQWLINLILFGNYTKLRRATLEEFDSDLSGQTLQVSCCYGNLTPLLAEAISQSKGTLDVVDILSVQLENVRRKLSPHAPVRLLRMDASALDLPDSSYDRVLLFFLLHEQPHDYKERTLHEALRVLKPGGTIVIVDYAKPLWWHPLRYLVLPFLAYLEPFAVDLWKKELTQVLPQSMALRRWEKTSYFGGLYQKLVSSG